MAPLNVDRRRENRGNVEEYNVRGDLPHAKEKSGMIPEVPGRYNLQIRHLTRSVKRPVTTSIMFRNFCLYG